MNMLEACTKGAQTIVSVSYEYGPFPERLNKTAKIQCKMNMHFLEENILLYFQVLFFFCPLGT